MTEPTVSSPAQSSQRVFWFLLALGVSLILALVVGRRVVGVLYSIVAPPDAPLPTDTREISHTSAAYGVDEWVYGTDQNACELVSFYIDQQGECRIAPNACSETNFGATEPTPGEHVARCTGVIPFSIFTMRWEAIIATNYVVDGRTHFRLLREIFWTGQAPPNPQTLPYAE